MIETIFGWLFDMFKSKAQEKIQDVSAEGIANYAKGKAEDYVKEKVGDDLSADALMEKAKNKAEDYVKEKVGDDLSADALMEKAKDKAVNYANEKIENFDAEEFADKVKDKALDAADEVVDKQLKAARKDMYKKNTNISSKTGEKNEPKKAGCLTEAVFYLIAVAVGIISIVLVLGGFFTGNNGLASMGIVVSVIFFIAVFIVPFLRRNKYIRWLALGALADAIGFAKMIFA